MKTFFLYYRTETCPFLPMSYPKNFLHYLQAIKIITALLWNPSTSISSKLVLFFGIAQYFRKSFYIKAFV